MRPQLFGEPGASKSSKSRPSRQPDFGPSILATIDGIPRRDTRASDATPLKRVLWMSCLALAVVGVYLVVKFEMLPDAASPSAAGVVAAPTPLPAVKAVEPVVVAPPVVAAASATDGAASIENVAVAPAASAAERSTTTPNVTASLNNIQQVLARPDTAEPQDPQRVAPREPVATAKAHAAAKENPAPPRAASPAPKPSAKAANDGDAELLAAMLPHLKRRGTTPTSPAYEKRCGQLTDEAAAVECRAKFCNGREGVDAACPSAVGR
jgi:hypothetical protein